eukprot:1034316-Ditylum_brightwellii.AAC.1
MADESTQLFSSIDIDPNNIYYFCTARANRDEALRLIDDLPQVLWNFFPFDDLCLICNPDNPEQGPIQDYHDNGAENTDNVILGFAVVIKDTMDTLSDNSLALDI